MSRTYRNNRVRAHRAFGSWLMNWDKGQWRQTGPAPKGDSKPFDKRHVTPEGKQQTWFCRCEDYCVAGKLHKHLKKPTIHWELKQLEYTYGPEID